MLNRNQNLYTSLIARLPLSELTALYERSKPYPMLCRAIEQEIDQRIAPNDEKATVRLAAPAKPVEMDLVSAS